ncbi:T9SS type A sorting domain-containing protein [Dyadobacter soli]|uniref:T9SS type A sorting domain-containing protein n=1 Tax=Dyadobacter soli TaxID=659014 RepID=UPI001E33D241|nr:T9SS type A sorting domain-containing protein [Dyadobacter soli]
MILILSVSFAWGQPAPFVCSNLAYQVSGPAGGNSSLYSYNVASGSRALLGGLPITVNAIGYNPLDNYIWGMANSTNQIIKLGSNVQYSAFTIPNLPVASGVGYNVGEIIGDGYMFLYSSGQSRYYVVDLNPARATYLQLVDPTSSYSLDNAPYGNAFSGTTGIAVSDLTYSAATGLLYGIVDAGAGAAYKLVTVNPVTRVAVASANAISGAGIQGETSGYGSAFIDQSANNFYVFANTLGQFFRINLGTNTAALVSTSVPAESNDGASCPNTFFVEPAAFTCQGLAYQVTSEAGTNSNLYSYNVATGARALLSELTVNANAVAYNTLDNYLWGLIATTNRVVKIGSNGGSQMFTVPNLPNPSAGYNVGDIIGNGYLLFYDRTETRYYVVDLDASRATYLQLVDPTASFVLDTAPYGNQFSTAPAVLNLSDLAYNPATGLLYGLTDPTSTSPFRSVTLNPVTRAVTFGPAVSGGGIQGETAAYGSIFIDQNADGFYAFANSQGRFYRVNSTTNTATLVSISVPATNNDGASCPDAFLTASIAGNVFHDPDAGNVDNSTGSPNTVPSGLFANLVGTDGNVVGVVSVNTDGTYQFTDIAPGDYTVVLSTTSGSIGGVAPAASLPAGWVNTGEFNGAENTGNTAPVDGISPVFTIGVNSTDVNFGIQQPPVADPKTYTVPNAAFSFTPVATYPTFPDYMAIQASSANLTGYPTGGSLSGSDAEDCPAGECNTDTGTTFNIVSIEPTTRLYYDFGAGPVAIDVTGGPVSIPNFEMTKLVIYGAVGSGTGNNLIGFTYSITDQAGATSTAVAYTIQTEGPMPVTLISFDARLEGQTVNLAWATSTEQNSMGFEIQRSGNAANWSKVEFVTSLSPETGSSSKLDYIFTDTAPLKGTSYYRLKMIDFDQSFAYSQIRSVNGENGQSVTLYPNPVSTLLLIKNVPNERIGRIRVLDLTGRAVIDQRGMPAHGIDVSRLPAGTYIVDIEMLDGSHTKNKIIVGR